MIKKQVRFFPVYHPQTETQVGEIKSDPFRHELKWTALSMTGLRLGDFATREEATTAVIIATPLQDDNQEKEEK